MANRLIIYTAYPDPHGRNAQVGNVYNEDGTAKWDCRCGAVGLLAGGLSEHQCVAIRRENASHMSQRRTEKMGTPTGEHPNEVWFDADNIPPSAFIDWVRYINEGRWE